MEATKKSKKKIISKHISYNEGVRSATATKLKIDNNPSDDILKKMVVVAEEVFEPLRDWAKHPINVNSFYRSPELNAAVKGSQSSSHIKGEAIDISTLGKKTNGELFDYIKEKLEFDQLIWEFGNDENPRWIHVSYKNKKDNRKDVLKAKYRGGRVTYLRM
jgi:zinc D-Ala-D-Ala carboxypeptidase